ncbi:MAG: MgtC/SapB family protein [Clostridia bacterium]|nr:MgtC/SapB family protein [Clostridia bacterium]
MEQFFINLWDAVSHSSEWVYLLRIFIACLCGGIIGIERTLRQKDAGFRTHLIVALGSALMMVISKYGFADSIDFDAARVASNIITGISFLGAGMIFVKGINIKGLTTAAGIWATAAVGMAVGSGLYITGIVATLLLVLIQIVFHTFLIGFDKVLANDVTVEMVVRIKNTEDSLERFKDILRDKNIEYSEIKIELGDDGYFTVTLTVKGDREIDVDGILEAFNEHEHIRAISF